MDIKKIINANVYTPELENALQGTKVYPLIQELHLTYGLEVTAQHGISWYDYDDNYQYRYNLGEDDSRNIKDCFMLSCRGIPVALAYYDIPHDKYAFHYKTSVKDRGKTSWDRRTITSNKISQIIKTIAKKEIDFGNVGDFGVDGTSMKGHYKVNNVTVSKLKEDMERWQKTLNGGYEIHEQALALVENQFGNKKDLKPEHIKYFEEFIDRNNELCETYNSAKELVDSEFTNGFYAFGINPHNDTIMVGNYIKNESAMGSREYYVLQDTDVISKIEDFEKYETITPILTMLKVTLENKYDNYIKRDYWIDSSYVTWYEDLGVLYKSNTYSEGSLSNPFNVQWLLISRGDECNTETETLTSEETM